MHYFGTDLDSAGHYFWLLDDADMRKSKVYFGDIPFNPEELTPDRGPNGVVKFLQVNGYSVLAIAGSCTDRRPGSKSVFWIKEVVDAATLKAMILAIPIAKAIIARMPFGVQW